MHNKYIPAIMLILCSHFAAADSASPMQLLSSGFYANSQNPQKDNTLLKIQVSQDESNITLLSVSSRNMYVSDGYGVDEYGGQLNPPVTFTYISPQNYLASNDNCTAKLIQKTTTSFKISVNDETACFGEYGMFASSGAITKKMLVTTFYLDASTANIQTLHGN